MKKYILMALFGILVGVFYIFLRTSIPVETKSVKYHFSEEIKPVSYNSVVGKINLESVAIRLIVLRHCPDAAGNPDARGVLEAVNIGASKGLNIKDLGDFRITPNGGTELRRKVVWQAASNDKFAGLKEFISEQMKVDAVPGDTMIIYTMGHGGGDGLLVTLGQRKEILKVIAEAAEENSQETLWWSMNCHADAYLPRINTLNETQQELVSVLPTSTAHDLSWFSGEIAVFKKLFTKMAEEPKEIDKDGDEVIVAKELADFLNSYKFSGHPNGSNKGSLLLSKSPDEPIFGLLGGIARNIKIINKTEGNYPEKYIPIPKRNKIVPEVK